MGKFNDDLANACREYRTLHRMSQGQFATQLGTNQVTLSGIESGKHLARSGVLDALWETLHGSFSNPPPMMREDNAIYGANPTPRSIYEEAMITTMLSSLPEDKKVALALQLTELQMSELQKRELHKEQGANIPPSKGRASATETAR